MSSKPEGEEHAVVDDLSTQFADSATDNGGTTRTLNKQQQILTPDHLSLAASTGRIEIVKAIVEAGGDPSKPDSLGDTPLHHATRLGLEDISDWLIGHGAPANATNRDGITPLELANEYGQEKMVAWLLEKGVQPPVAWQQPKIAEDVDFLEFELVKGDMLKRLRSRFAELKDLFIPLDIAVFRTASLPFYANTVLVAVEDPNRRGLRERLVLVEDPANLAAFSVLDWKNERIYEWNDRYGLDLADDGKAIAYLKFFFYFVRGQIGRFLFVEDAARLDWLDEASEADRARVARHIGPLHVIERTSDFVRLRGIVWFKNALFRSDAIFSFHACTLTLADGDQEGQPETFCVGQGKLLNEDLLEEELPVRIPGPVGRFG